MKKIFLILVMVVVMFGWLNAGSISTGELNVYKGAKKSIVVDEKSKKVFMTFLFPREAEIDANSLINVQNSLNNIMCQNPTMNSAITKNGFEVIVTYIYKEKVVVHSVIDSCPQ